MPLLLKLAVVLLAAMPLTACNVPGLKKCPDAAIDWVDILMINDITYSAKGKDEINPNTIQQGNKIGEVSYQLADNACSDHLLQNGDAAFLKAGTPLYEQKGYQSNYRIVANGKIYEVEQNPKAKKIADLYDISNRVERISIVSSEDESHLSDFSKESTVEFVQEFLSQPYVGREKISGKTGGDERVFLQFHLKDGSRFREVFWTDQDVMTPGIFTTNRMKEIVEKEVSKK